MGSRHYVAFLCIVAVSAMLIFLAWVEAPTYFQLPKPWVQDSVNCTTGGLEDFIQENITREFLQVHERLGNVFNISSIGECNDKDMQSICRQSSCNATIPRDPVVDLQKVLEGQEPIPDSYLSAMKEMHNQVQGWYDVTILTGSSANHYEESQGVVKSLHLHTFPRLQQAKKSFLFIYYDLGLLPAQRKQLQAQCRCTVLDFPFEKFPDFVKYLFCYTWKPIIINSHHGMSPVTLWFDAAVRLHNKSLDPLIDHIMKKGVATFPHRTNLALYTAPPMMEYFGDPACRYSPYPHFHAGVLGFRNSPWVRQGLLTPWVACALSPRCMCPPGKWRTKEGLSLKKKWGFGQAHRYDQSALDILLSKMFREKAYDFQPPTPYDFNRDQPVKYFT